MGKLMADEDDPLPETMTSNTYFSESFSHLEPAPFVGFYRMAQRAGAKPGRSLCDTCHAARLSNYAGQFSR